MTSRVVTSWMAPLGTFDLSRALEMTVEMATKDSVDSLPPLRMAALPDLMASEAMLAMTSGRASKMMRRTPMGQVTRSRIRPSSSLVRSWILPTVWSCQSHVSLSSVHAGSGRVAQGRAGGGEWGPYQGPPNRARRGSPSACRRTCRASRGPAARRGSATGCRRRQRRGRAPCRGRWRRGCHPWRRAGRRGWRRGRRCGPGPRAWRGRARPTWRRARRTRGRRW